MMREFEADLCPETGDPQIRFNFPNGWSAAVILRGNNRYCSDFGMASMARCPTGKWGTGAAEILGNELSSEEVAHRLAGTACLSSPSPPEQAS